VRVDRAADPLAELARLLDAADAFSGFSRAVELLTAGHGDDALSTIDEALGVLPDQEILQSLRIGALMATGQTAAAIAEARALVAGRPTWAVIIRSMADKGMLGPLPAGTSIEDLLAGA
jgi:predicted Zn-dependent protease